MKKLIFSWLGFCLVVVLSFISCGFFIYFLSKADYSFNKLIVSRHNSLLAFSNINSPSPAVLSKEEFLNEVRYLGNLKEDVDVLEEGILGRIFAAFQLHPWVYKVVEIQREGANNLKVVLEFRVPAMVDALRSLEKKPSDKPLAPINEILKDSIAAISLGIVDNKVLLDLCYEEDAGAEVDSNLVMTGSGMFIEVQASGEESVFDQKQLDSMLKLGKQAIGEIKLEQMKALGSNWPLD